ncbi:hypothetical protein HAX54_014932 [Datura stramonium]|uniref:Uncharacterized protein n=1 Tax=Datura stramonium TaxID=4076 RepID=A0ABS8TRR8_DATST|nr:hypothetical protein [Datura stramonium]
MQVEAKTCNDVQATDLANIQDEPRTEEESKFLQKDNCEEIETVSQSWNFWKLIYKLVKCRNGLGSKKRKSTRKLAKFDAPRWRPYHATITEAVCLEGIFILISSGGARWHRVTEPKLRVYLHATLKTITWKLSSSEAPRQGRGTKLMLCDTLRATLPVIPGKISHLYK